MTSFVFEPSDQSCRIKYSDPAILSDRITTSSAKDCANFVYQRLGSSSQSQELTTQQIQEVEDLALQYSQLIWEGLLPSITLIFVFVLLLKILRSMFSTA